MAIVKQDFRVAGTTFSHRQNYLAYLVNGGKKFRTTLVREPGNRKDKNAILVIAQTEGSPKKRLPLGYVPRELAEKLAPMMDNGQFIYVNEVKITGGFGYNYGAAVNIGWYSNPSAKPVRNRQKAVS